MRANYVFPVIAFVFPHCIRAKKIPVFPGRPDLLLRAHDRDVRDEQRNAGGKPKKDIQGVRRQRGRPRHEV